MRRISGVLERDQPLVTRPFTGDCSAVGGARLWLLPHAAGIRPARELLPRYRPHDPAGFRGAVQDCAFVLFDETTRTLVLGRDALGTTPLYYAATPTSFAYSTRIADLFGMVSLDAAPNRRALAHLLVDHSAPVIGETYFANVLSVPPGGVVMLRDGRVTVIRAADIETRERTDISFATAVERFRQHFNTAVASRLDHQQPTAGLISGGLDSAAIMCTAARAGNAFGIHYGLQDGSPADESRYVDAIAEAGLRIERIPFYPTTGLGGIEASVRESETPNIDQVTWTLQRAAACARAAGARTLLLGTWGDQVLSPFPPAHLGAIAPWQRGQLQREARAYQQYMTDVPEPDIVRALMRQSLRRIAPGWLLERRRRRFHGQSIFDELADEFPAPEVLAEPTSYAEAVWRSVTSPQQVEAIEGTTKWGDANDIDVRLPFVDRALVGFLATMPDDHAYHQHSLKPLLRESMRGIVPEQVRTRRDKGDYTRAIAAGWIARNEALEYLGDLRMPVEAGLMSRASATKVLARLRNGSEIDPGMNEISRLLGVCAWLGFATRIRAAG